MTDTKRNSKSALRGKRRGPCFGAPDTNPSSPNPTKEGEEAAMRLLEYFDWGSDEEKPPP